MILSRSFHAEAVRRAFRVNPVVGLLGPRQSGKTTLARRIYADANRRSGPLGAYFDLENPKDQARLDDPLLALGSLKGLVVIDEIQRTPRLFETLRVLVDRKPRPARFLILGSASRDLIRQSSESLAGRISYVELPPFGLHELPRASLSRLWLRGGFPKSFLAPSDRLSLDWREAYIATYLERDLPNLGIQIPARTMRRFWMMLAHYHGQIFNASEIGASLGIAHTTVGRYLDILEGTFMMRRLPAWTENIGKRQVKAPKIFFRDSGLFHALLGVKSEADLSAHPKLGASWEGFALETVIRRLGVPMEKAFYWATHNQAELDLLVFDKSKRLGFEFKYAAAPRLTSSMRIAVRDLNLSSLTVVYPGEESFALAKNVSVVGLGAFRKGSASF